MATTALYTLKTCATDRLLKCFRFLPGLLLVLSATLYAADYDTLIQESLRLRNSGDFVGAETRLREAFNLVDDKREVAYLLGLVLAFQEKYTEAQDILDAALLQSPEDIGLQLASARVNAYQGQYREARQVVNAILERDAGNYEARNLAGRVALYQNRYAEGKAHFLQVLKQDPDNLEALIGVHDSDLYLGNKDLSDEALRKAQRLAPDHADVLVRLNKERYVKKPQHELFLGFETSSFNKVFLTRWYDRFLEYRHYSPNRNQQFLRTEHAHRFGLHDSLIEAGALMRGTTSIPVEIALGISDNAEFLPEYRLTVTTRVNVNQGDEGFGATIASIRYRNSKYQTGSTHQLNIDFEHYFADANAWIIPGVGTVIDENGESSLSWRLGIHGQLGARLRTGFTFSDAPETENNITIDTRVMHVYARYRLTNRFSIRLDGVRNLRENVYTRDSLGVTLAYKF